MSCHPTLQSKLGRLKSVFDLRTWCCPHAAEMYGERLFFTCTGSDGVERELSPGGSARRVTFDNRLAFCRMVEHARTHEFDAQVSHYVSLTILLRRLLKRHSLSSRSYVLRYHLTRGVGQAMLSSASCLPCGGDVC